MLPTVVLACLTIQGAELFLVILTHGYFSPSYFSSWDKSGTKNPANLLKFSMGWTIIGFAGSLTLNNICFFTCVIFYQQYQMFKVLTVISLFAGSYNFWLTAWLSTLLCLKVINFTHPVLVQFRQRLPTIVPWVLLASALTSITACLPSACGTWLDPFTNSTDICSWNSTTEPLEFEYTIPNKFAIVVLGFSLPFALIAFTVLLLVASLLIHMQQMAQGATGFNAPNMEAHTEAARTVPCFLCLYLCHYLTLVVFILGVFKKGSPWYWVCSMTMASFSPVYFTLVSLKNPIERRLCTGILCCARR